MTDTEKREAIRAREKAYWFYRSLAIKLLKQLVANDLRLRKPIALPTAINGSVLG